MKLNIINLMLYTLVLLLSTWSNASSFRKAATDSSLDEDGSASMYQENESPANARTVRRFHEVLEELLAEFGHDVKSGQIQNLKKSISQKNHSK